MSIRHAHDFFIQWHLTERCNLRCAHCYQFGRKTDELSLPQIKDVIGEVSEMLKAWADAYDINFSPSFNITGGEPFLREDLSEILEEISGRGFEIYLLSNGTLIDGKRAEMLSCLGVKGVQISMEGPEEIHEAIRGRGSFSASIAGISHLLKAGVDVSINTTLSEINADRFMEMVSLSSSIGVRQLGFSRLVPTGRGADLINKMIGKERLRDIYEAISSVQAKGIEIVTGDPVASQMTAPACDEDSGQIATSGCAAGISGLTLLPDGVITPCRRLFIPIGNVRRDRLREVWATSGILAALRDRNGYKGRCGRCKRWALCRGCRAIAYAYSRSKGEDDFLCEDPQCFIQEGP